MPYGEAQATRELGEGGEAVTDVSGLRDGVHVSALDQQDLRGEGVSERIGEAGGSSPLANRVDRLAGLGNAVVPAVAAKAWTELKGQLVLDGFGQECEGMCGV